MKHLQEGCSKRRYIFSNICLPVINYCNCSLQVLFDFAPQASNQIALKTGQVININRYSGPGSWSEGIESGSGRVGFFPSDYVQLLPKVQKQVVAPPAPPPPVVQKSKPAEKLMAKALYDFAGGSPNEMSFKAGETFEIVERGLPGSWSKVSYHRII